MLKVVRLKRQQHELHLSVFLTWGTIGSYIGNRVGKVTLFILFFD